tara:strand:- start:9102 stop:9461 length:360 start_codon:yes stop_codon:yes gene_type:complete
MQYIIFLILLAGLQACDYGSTAKDSKPIVEKAVTTVVEPKEEITLKENELVNYTCTPICADFIVADHDKDEIEFLLKRSVFFTEDMIAWFQENQWDSSELESKLDYLQIKLAKFMVRVD